MTTAQVGQDNVALIKRGYEAFGAGDMATLTGLYHPDAAFFTKVIAAAGAPAHRIAYVGDRLDNDVLPAKAAGMTAVFIRRGPWGLIHGASPEAGRADLRIDGLDGLPSLLTGLG